MKRCFVLLVFLMTWCQSGYSVIELSGSFGYDRQVYGVNRDSKNIGRTYKGAVAFYFWKLTAVEFNYQVTDDIITDTERKNLGTNFDIVSQQDRVQSTIYGIGLRQALTSRKAFAQPVISIGYAKEFTTGTTSYEVEDSGVVSNLAFEIEDSRADSVFATFTLRFNITRTLTLNGSVQTVFPWWELEEAKDNVYYTAGFSWFL